MNIMKSLGKISFTCLLIFGIGGCAYFSIPREDDIQERPIFYKGSEKAPVYNSAVIKGTVITTDKFKTATILAAYPLLPESAAFTDYILLEGTKPFMLYLPEGRYYLYTVTDFDNDGIYKDTEVSGVYGFPPEPREISLHEGEMVKNIVIHTSRDHIGKITPPRKFRIQEDIATTSQRTFNGQVVKIYNEMFSPENSATGWWNPTAFMKAFGAHIYFLEPYDPGKIPVLFVHGAEGSPQNWINFLVRLDRNRYQPWVFYYPSGIRLSLAARLLYDELTELQQKYAFRKLGMAAHSMGGLITRSLLTQYEFGKQDNLKILYATFATPWSGFEAADASHIIPYKMIPSWMDMRSQSIFIKRTMNTDLPPNVRYVLFYGKADTVAKGKALDERARSGAYETVGFDCDHNTILTDRKTFLKFKEVLDKELRR